MTDPSTAHPPTVDATLANLPTSSPEKPSNVIADTVGAAFGALAFALCALWLGPVAGLAIALLSTLHALWRRRPRVALAFVVAGALSAAATWPSATFALLGGLAYGFGLALAALRRHQDELLA